MIKSIVGQQPGEVVNKQWEEEKLSAFDYIKLCLEMGTLKGVEVTHDLGKKFTVTSFIDGSEGGHISDSYGNGWANNVILNMNITSITPIPNPPKLLPVGTKVRVFEKYRIIKKIPEDIHKIKFVDGVMCLYMIGKGYSVPSRAVVPVWED